MQQKLVQLIQEMGQKQICISLSKIHNWAEDYQVIELDLDFYSKESQHLITRKHVSATTSNNQLNFNITLKIRYPANQNKILIDIKQTNGNCEDFGQVQIDLDELAYQKIKYIAFGRFQKILQIQSGIKKKDKSNIYNNKNMLQKNIPQLTLQQKCAKNKQFLQGRRKFLEQYTQKQNQLKNQLEQKIQKILARQPKKQNYRKKVIENIEYNNYEEQDIPNYTARSYITKKSTHEGFKAKSAFHDNITNVKMNNKNNYQGNIIEDDAIMEDNKQRKTQPAVVNSPKKHKLILNTLNIVSKEDKNS